MPIVRLDDLNDPRLLIYRSLKATNETRGLPLFVLEGEKLLDDLLTSRYPLESVVVVDRHALRIAAKVPPDIPIYVLPRAQMGELVGFNFHQGVLACGRRVSPPGLDQIFELGAKTTLLVAPTLHNPENLGAIVRIADVFGAQGVVVGDEAPDPLSRRVLRVSMGTALRVPVLAVTNLAVMLEMARVRHGLRLIATVTDPMAEPIASYARRRAARLALLLGTEAHGLAQEWLDRADDRVTIPMRPGAESLNVAIATGILLHRLMENQADISGAVGVQVQR